MDLTGDFQGQFDGLAGGFAGDHGGGAGADGMDEAFEFEFKRFFFLEGYRFADDAFATEFADDGGITGREEFFEQGGFFLMVAGDAVDETFLSAVIEGEVTGHGTGAEDADFAEALGADTAGGEVGDATVGEPEAGVGDIFGLAEDVDADGIDMSHGRFNKRQDKIEVVDHQVENDADISAASGVGGEAMGFDEAGIGGHGLEVSEDRVEAFDVTDLENTVVIVGEFD